MTPVKALWMPIELEGMWVTESGWTFRRMEPQVFFFKNGSYLHGIDIARLVENFSTFCETNSFLFFHKKRGGDFIYKLIQVYFCCSVPFFLTQGPPTLSCPCLTCRIAGALHLIGLIGTASYPDVQKIRIIGFFFENSYTGSLKFGCYYLHYVPASEPFDHA